MKTDEMSSRVIGAAIRVHSHLGPGLLESTYEACLAVEFEAQALRYERQHMLGLEYGGKRIECAYRVDFLVEDCLVVECKAVAKLDPVHTAQLLTYLRLTGCTAGLLINFNVVMLRDGLRRLVLNHQRSPRSSRLVPFQFK